MKHLKSFEHTIVNEMNLSIDIKNINDSNISELCKKLIDWFPNYRFEDDVDMIRTTNPKYLKFNYKNYNYIILTKANTFFLNSYVKEYQIINYNIVLTSNSQEDFIGNVEQYLLNNKYNI